jgi:hypothetical protein
MLDWFNQGSHNFLLIMHQLNILNEDNTLNNYDSMADLTSKLQAKVNEMTGEMTEKADELDNHIEEVN